MKKTNINNIENFDKKPLVKTSLFGIGITNGKKEEVLEYVSRSLEKTQKKYYIVTPNPEMIVYATHHPEFQAMLNQAEIALCDGMQLFRAAKLVGKPVQERITGVDFMESLCATMAKKPVTVGFLGGRNGVAKKASECLQKKYPGLKVGFVGEDVVCSMYHVACKEKHIHTTNYKLHATIDILFVAFGFPKQEEWMCKNISKLNVRLMVGVGGAFNEIAGKEKSPPLWIDRLGFKWLWRLVHEPWRWKRQLALIEFVWMVVKAKIKNFIILNKS